MSHGCGAGPEGSRTDPRLSGAAPGHAVTARNGSDGGPLGSTPKQRGGVTGKGFVPGVSGNPAGRARGDGLMRRKLMQSFKANQKEALAALARRWGNPRYVQDMWELLAKLEGELSKDAAATGSGIRVIVLNNTGPHPLDPAVFREAAAKRVLLERNGCDGDGGE
jgi:hypothetical protein